MNLSRIASGTCIGAGGECIGGLLPAENASLWLVLYPSNSFAKKHTQVLSDEFIYFLDQLTCS